MVKHIGIYRTSARKAIPVIKYNNRDNRTVIISFNVSMTNYVFCFSCSNNNKCLSDRKIFVKLLYKVYGLLYKTYESEKITAMFHATWVNVYKENLKQRLITACFSPFASC